MPFGWIVCCMNICRQGPRIRPSYLQLLTFLGPRSALHTHIHRSVIHRVGRVLSFFSQSSELGLPHPHLQASGLPRPLVHGGGAHSLAGEGLGEPQFRRGVIHCGTLCCYTLRNNVSFCNLLTYNYSYSAKRMHLFTPLTTWDRWGRKIPNYHFLAQRMCISWPMW